MINLNRIEVIGNLTRDPELRQTPTAKSVTNFSVATNRRYRDEATGTWIDTPPEYHEIVIWGQLGERCSQVLHKGDRVYVTGRLQTRSWEAPEGGKKYKTEVVADTVIGPDLVNKFQAGASGGIGTEDYLPATEMPVSKAPSTPSAAKGKKASSVVEEEINIDDIPF